jgi:hypothetical protein
VVAGIDAISPTDPVDRLFLLAAAAAFFILSLLFFQLNIMITSTVFLWCYWLEDGKNSAARKAFAGLGDDLVIAVSGDCPALSVHEAQGDPVLTFS